MPGAGFSMTSMTVVSTDKQALERQGWNHAEIDRCYGVCMVAQECLPSLR